MSLGVTRLSASPRASECLAFVLASARRSDCLPFENLSSSGVESGLYGGSGRTHAPTRSIDPATPEARGA
jgi:hypothetical protein